MSTNSPPGLLVSRKALDDLQIDRSLLRPNGKVSFASFHTARVLAQRMNEKRDLLRFPEQATKAGQLNAAGLIEEILRYVVAAYHEQRNPQVLAQAMVWLHERLGEETVDAALQRFADAFPPLAIYERAVTPAAYLEEETDGIPHRQTALVGMMMLWLANVNPAFSPFLELLDDAALDEETAYTQIISSLHEFFVAQPVFGPDSQNLVDMLRSPAIAAPDSLSGQLEYMRERWGYLLGRYLRRLLSSLDMIREEEKIGLPGPGPAQVVDFTGLELEPERFSRDLDWMPRLVLIAKNAYVWLDQLSKQYGRPLTRLDHIPDEELDVLARRGFTGLWLIGLWERSQASQRIKQMCGNPEAVASAYSLFDYQIAADLGGDEAYQELKARAWRRGIRLASDMVPNHMGIDSKWVIEHPDWFISLDHRPFPAYTFSGPDLSWDEHVGIYLEDHYYDRSDAAVVFKRVDHWTGEERYVYHGNDGTSMPWNDTAQLDYLNPEVREAVIQSILHVARRFPIVRFDAAMTLAKKHYQRLWFPEPGTGGAIPSRAEHGMSREQFDAALPTEFWREVVDRVAQEVPDTLLLAEAFWLMEGYFVRTLGMHRVYNSAFMNMLRDEDNAGYRSVIKNTLEFDPQILKRYVNFMNNPDERTTVDQFGKGDKYFGICTMMATMPGLPMVGHGQVEGFTEKYGMEYRRAYWDEQPDAYLVERHGREIFPLLRQRYLFADVAHFLLYDVFTPEGHVDENVFAYSNRSGDELSLVVYHNRYAETRGWIRTSAAYADIDRASAVKADQGAKVLVQRSLGEGLGLSADGDTFTIFRDHVTGLEYIRNSKDVHDRGLYVELGAYQYHVFLDFRQVRDNELHHYAQLAAYLHERGVPNIEEALHEMLLQPVHRPFRELVNPSLFHRLIDARVTDAPDGPRASLPADETALPGPQASPPADETAHPGPRASLPADEATHPGPQASPPADETAPPGPRASLPADETNLPGTRASLPAPDATTAQPTYQSTSLPTLLDEVEQKMAHLLGEVAQFAGHRSQATTAQEVRRRLDAILHLPVVGSLVIPPCPQEHRQAATQAIEYLQAGLREGPATWPTLLAWLFTHALGQAVDESDFAHIARAWIDEWMLGKIIVDTLRDMGLDTGAARRAVTMVKVLTGHQRWFEETGVFPENLVSVGSAGAPLWRVLEPWLQDESVQQFLLVNRYGGVVWFNKEAFEQLLWWMLLIATVALSADPLRPAAKVSEGIARCYEVVRALLQAAEESGYQLERLQEAIQQ